MKEIVIKVPEWAEEREVKRIVNIYLKKVKAVKRFYELLEGVDFGEFEKEAREFRESFKLRFSG